MKERIPLLAAACLALSCQNLVLENRGACPSLLLFDITNAASFEEIQQVHLAAFSYPEEVYLTTDTSIVADIQSRNSYLKVQKRDAVQGFGVMGFERALNLNKTEWVVPEGQNYVPLFRFDYKVPAREESVLIPVEFVKDYCAVNVQFLHFDRFEGAGGRFPFTLAITGHTAGIDAISGIPVQGDFRYEPPLEGGGRFRFVVPRQADHSLCLELYGIPGLGQEEGLCASFNLWDLFREQADFSWDARNLPDVDLEIDYMQCSFHVCVSPWEKGGDLTFEI